MPLKRNRASTKHSHRERGGKVMTVGRDERMFQVLTVDYSVNKFLLDSSLDDNWRGCLNSLSCTKLYLEMSQ
jgi:hypothetical protein